MNFIVIIPARFSSTRLPGKPLMDIRGKPMIIHVMNRAIQSGADRVIVATDHSDIATVVSSVGGEVCLTCCNHQSGTERLAEVVDQYHFTDDTIIVNLQGDYPLIPPGLIQQVVSDLINRMVNISTLAAPINNKEEVLNPNVVKVVCDSRSYALYFSRAPIPWNQEYFMKTSDTFGDDLLRHIGIYAYRSGFIRNYVNWGPSPIEKIELLEQLRVLWNGEKIYVSRIYKALALGIETLGVDTIEDLKHVRMVLAR